MPSGASRFLVYTGRALSGTAAVGFAWCVYAYLTLPDVRPLATVNPSSTAFMDLREREALADGKPLRHVQHWATYRQISPNLTRAVLVAEDDAFWQHEGVDFEQVRESLQVDWQRGRIVRGASTITQQLAKNLYLSPSQNPIRKFRELIIARRLEAALSKARILELYLNVVEWGDGVYGADAAASTYFSRRASELSPEQSALLAGALVNPRLLTPARPTPRLLGRQRLILRRMGAVSPPAPEPEPAPTAPDGVEPEPAEPAATVVPGVPEVPGDSEPVAAPSDVPADDPRGQG